MNLQLIINSLMTFNNISSAQFLHKSKRYHIGLCTFYYCHYVYLKNSYII